jgi:hypothetical protein
MFLDVRFWVLSRRLRPEDPKHTGEVAAIGGHVGMVGAKGRLANRQRPPQLGPSAFQIPKLSRRRCRSTGFTHADLDWRFTHADLDRLRRRLDEHEHRATAA